MDDDAFQNFVENHMEDLIVGFSEKYQDDFDDYCMKKFEDHCSGYTDYLYDMQRDRL